MAFTAPNGRTQTSLADINITPLVDVVLVLLIIFMVVVPLLIEGYNVDIPRSSADAVPAQSAESQLVLSIGRGDVGLDCALRVQRRAAGFPVRHHHDRPGRAQEHT